MEDGREIIYHLDDVGNREKKITTEPNLPPVAVDDTVSHIALNTAGLAWLTFNDSDPDGHSLTIISVTQPWNGVVTISTPTTVTIFVTADGEATFTYTISDGHGGTATATVTLEADSGGGGGFP